MRICENGSFLFSHTCADTSLCCQGNVCCGREWGSVVHWGAALHGPAGPLPGALGLLLVLLQLLILAQGLRMSLACHCYCKTYLSALPRKTNHDCLQAILRFPTRTFLRRRYVTWRRDLAAPLLAMMFFRAMSYCANLRKWKLPVLAYLRGH